MWPNPQFPADLVTFTEEILNGELHFLYSVCSTTSINLGKMCIHFPELLLLKCNKNVVCFSKTTQNNVKGPFFFQKCPFCHVMFGGSLYFLNKTLDQVYNNKLRNYNTKNRKYIYIYIYITPCSTL